MPLILKFATNQLECMTRNESGIGRSFPCFFSDSAMSSVGRVAQGVASIFLRPVTVFVGAIAAISTAADQGLARALDSIPAAADSAAREMGLYADEESRRNTELWEVRITLFCSIIVNETSKSTLTSPTFLPCTACSPGRRGRRSATSGRGRRPELCRINQESPDERSESVDAAAHCMHSRTL